MKRWICLIIFFVTLTNHAEGQGVSISGKVLSVSDNAPVSFAFISVPEYQQWTVAEEDGTFSMKNLPKEHIEIVVSCLGYVPKTFKLDLKANVTGILFSLNQNNLSLDEVIVTAQARENAITSSYLIEKTALEHGQMQNLADITSLLPGGETNRNLSLAGSRDPSSLFIRGNKLNDNDNSVFGTAIMVDGVRLSANSSYSGSTTSYTGLDVRGINTENIESIEIITGVPSVEYGDVSNGIVKVNTSKGETPLSITLASKPNTKQVALSKGFILNKNKDMGVLNVNAEYARSVSDIASPYTMYERNNISLKYSKTFNRAAGQPLSLEAGITGNIGGYNSKSDPDAFENTYKKDKANGLTAYTSLKWMINKPWITEVEFSTSASFSDKERRDNEHKSSSSATAAIHSKEEGYYVAERYEDNPNATVMLIPQGYWYELRVNDSKPRDYAAKLKASWNHKFGKVNNSLMLGTELSSSGNEGRGMYYDTPSSDRYSYFVPTWREDRYRDKPYMNNFSLFAEEKLSIPIHSSNLQLVAGLRYDATSINASEYGTVSGLSPRFNAMYTFFENRKDFLKKIALKAGWGKSVKLPSMTILYPNISYSDIQTFASPTLSDGTSYHSYYTFPVQAFYNPDLKWQKTELTEVSLTVNTNIVDVTLTAFYNKTIDPYKYSTDYTSFSYKYTDISSLNGVPIPLLNREYMTDPKTGIITVSDKTGVYSPVDLEYRDRKRMRSNTFHSNSSGSTRKGLEWILNFEKIRSINTSFRLDGSYTLYRELDETISVYAPSTSQLMADGNHYKYKGFYVGSNSDANGSERKRLNTNLTMVTHIPKIRMIVSFRVENSLYNSSRILSEYSGGNRSFVVDNREDPFPSETSRDIYAGDQFVAMYPLYYTTYDDMDTKIPFTKELLLDARNNNPALYNELRGLVSMTNFNYRFNRDKLSSYYSANINVTKEIGDYASISFEARNFLNNMGLVKSSWNNTETTLYDSPYISNFYYGISLKLKIK